MLCDDLEGWDGRRVGGSREGINIYIYIIGDIYIYNHGWFALLYSRNQYNIVKQLSSNWKKGKKKNQKQESQGNGAEMWGSILKFVLLLPSEKNHHWEAAAQAGTTFPSAPSIHMAMWFISADQCGKCPVFHSCSSLYKVDGMSPEASCQVEVKNFKILRLCIATDRDSRALSQNEEE